MTKSVSVLYVHAQIKAYDEFNKKIEISNDL